MKTSVFPLILLPYPGDSKGFRPLWGHTENSKQWLGFANMVFETIVYISGLRLKNNTPY